jgi:hypothetical protein
MQQCKKPEKIMTQETICQKQESEKSEFTAPQILDRMFESEAEYTHWWEEMERLSKEGTVSMLLVPSQKNVDARIEIQTENTLPCPNRFAKFARRFQKTFQKARESRAIWLLWHGKKKRAKLAQFARISGGAGGCVDFRAQFARGGRK